MSVVINEVLWNNLCFLLFTFALESHLAIRFDIFEGLTQAQLGARCGMADSAIRRYESGRGNPTINTLERIATALDIPVGELIGTIPQPDRDYELVHDAITGAGFVMEAAGWAAIYSS